MSSDSLRCAVHTSHFILSYRVVCQMLGFSICHIFCSIHLTDSLGLFFSELLIQSSMP